MFLLKGLRISAHSASERKLLAGGRMDHVQRTVFAQQLMSLRASRTPRQIALRNACQPLKIVVTRVTEVRCAEAEEHGNGTAVAAFVLEEVSAVLRTHLGTRHVRTGSAHKLLRIEFVAHLGVATGLTAVVGLVALEAHVVSVAIHRVCGQVLGVGGLDLAFVLQAK